MVTDPDRSFRIGCTGNALRRGATGRSRAFGDHICFAIRWPRLRARERFAGTGGPTARQVWSFASLRHLPLHHGHRPPLRHAATHRWPSASRTGSPASSGGVWFDAAFAGGRPAAWPPPGGQIAGDQLLQRCYTGNRHTAFADNVHWISHSTLSLTHYA